MNARGWDEAYEGEVAETPVDRHVMGVAGRLAPGAALDLGCGLGQNSIWLAQQGWDVLGLDIAGNAVAGAVAAATATDAAVTFAQADLRTWQPERTYDLVISTYALPARGPGRTAAVRAAASAVAKGGTIVVVEFDQSLADEGWMAERDLVTVDEVVGLLDGLEIIEAGVENAPHTHGARTAELPVVVVVATRPD